MNTKKIIRHYQWQVRRLNKKINNNAEAKDILFRVVMNGKPENPCEIPMSWITRREKEYINAYSNIPGELLVLKFWFNARNAFVNRIAYLSGC